MPGGAKSRTEALPSNKGGEKSLPEKALIMEILEAPRLQARAIKQGY